MSLLLAFDCAHLPVVVYIFQSCLEQISTEVIDKDEVRFYRYFVILFIDRCLHSGI